MKIIRRLLVGGGVLASVGLYGWFVWPTPWEYKNELSESPFPPYRRDVPMKVRINRFTGEKQNLYGGTWGHTIS
jgi:hypothetical protein